MIVVLPAFTPFTFPPLTVAMDVFLLFHVFDLIFVTLFLLETFFLDTFNVTVFPTVTVAELLFSFTVAVAASDVTGAEVTTIAPAKTRDAIFFVVLRIMVPPFLYFPTSRPDTGKTNAL